MQRHLAGKRALVTGSSRGLGLATVRQLAADGCDVIVHGLDGVPALDATRRGIEHEFGVRALSSTADLREPSRIDELVSAALKEFGSVDILVNNAVARHTAPVERFSTEDWDEAIAVNLSSAFHTTRLLLPGMQRKGWGRIVNVSSIYGLRGAANRVGYVTTKTALLGLTRAVALETARTGVTCNAVCPGTSVSPTHEESLARLIAAGASRDAAEAQLLAGKQPTGRLIAEDGVAKLIAYLCTDAAADITGAALPIDGGWSAG
jgi:3-hydroxybutyrate dehydrogenase